MSVLLTVEKRGRTTYTEVADDLVREASSDSQGRARSIQVPVLHSVVVNVNVNIELI